MLLLLILTAALVPSAMGSRPSHNFELELDAETHVRMDPSQSVAMLNRHTFNTTVKQDHVDNWIVLFCVDWLEHCNGLWHDYRRMANHWEQVMAPFASSWQSTAVRFAEVDCATDKALCNENKVENYPSVVHFQGRKFASVWEISNDATSLSGDISKWIGKVLTAKPKNETDQAIGKHHGATGRQSTARLGANLQELLGLLSWEDPTTAAIGYLILAIAVSVVAWILGTGLELERATIFSYFTKEAKCKQWPSALLPELPEMPPPRTIVRSTIVL